MRASGVEGDDDLGMRIARIEIGDLHADRRIAKPSFAFELADLFAVEGHGDDRRAHGLVAYPQPCSQL